MFADLDESIRQLLVQHVPLDPSEIEISFDTPDREWSGRLTRPTINCFLYDVRENMKLRKIGWETRRDVASNVGTRFGPPYELTQPIRSPRGPERAKTSIDSSGGSCRRWPGSRRFRSQFFRATW